MTRGTARAAWAPTAHRNATKMAGVWLRRAARYANAARKKRDESYLTLAWGYLRLAAEAVRRMPEP